MNHGFCDMFLMPDLQRYSEVEHSYILELKFLPKDKFDAQSASQWDARGGADSRYAKGKKGAVSFVGEPGLHCIVMQFCGWELVRMEEM